MSPRRGRDLVGFTAVNPDASDARDPPERTETPRVWSSGLQMFRLRLPSPVDLGRDSIAAPAIDLRIPRVGEAAVDPRQPISPPHKLSPRSEFTRLANERAKPLLETIAAADLSPSARDRASAAQDADLRWKKQVASGLMQRRNTVSARGAGGGSSARRGTVDRAALLLAVNWKGRAGHGAGGLMGTSDVHEREAQQSFSQLASSYASRLAEVEEGGSGLWQHSSGAREASSGTAHQHSARSAREIKEARREAEAEKTRRRLEEFRANKQTAESVVEARLAELRDSPRDKAELEERCDEIVRERMVAANERGDVVDGYTEHVWEQARPGAVEEARQARSERARAEAALVAARRGAEVERRRLETLQQLSRPEMIVAKRVEAERRLALAQRQASWLALLALASRTAFLGATLEDERPRRDMERAVRMVQARLRRYQTRVKVRTIKRAYALIKSFIWEIGLRRRVKRKAAAQEVLRLYLLSISQSGVAYAAIRSCLYRVRQIQRSFRAHRAVVIAQVELTCRQVRKLEATRAVEETRASGGGGGGGVSESCLRETCFHLLALRRRRHVRLQGFYERASDAFKHVSRVAEVLAEAFELVEEEATEKAKAAKAEAEARARAEAKEKETWRERKVTRQQMGGAAAGVSFAEEEAAGAAGDGGGTPAVLTRKSNAGLDGNFLRKRFEERRRSTSGDLMAASDIHATVLERINAFGPSRLLWFIVTIQRRWRRVRQTRAQTLGLEHGRRTAVGPKTLDAFYEALIIKARQQRLLQQQQQPQPHGGSKKSLGGGATAPAFDRSLFAAPADIGTHRSLVAAADIAGRVRNATRLRRAAAEHGWGRSKGGSTFDERFVVGLSPSEQPGAAGEGSANGAAAAAPAPPANSKDQRGSLRYSSRTGDKSTGKSVFRSRAPVQEGHEARCSDTLHASALLLMDVRRPPRPPARLTTVLPSDDVADVLDASHVLEEESQRAGLHFSPGPARPAPPAAAAVEPLARVSEPEEGEEDKGEGWEEGGLEGDTTLGAVEAEARKRGLVSNPTGLRTVGIDRNDAVLMQGFDVDENSEKSVAEQLCDALSRAAVRVVDLFREWDDDGSGRISRAEFHKACGEMRFHAPAEDIDMLFDGWDPNGSGYLELKELQRLLRG